MSLPSYCKNCGAPLPPGAQSCKICGSDEKTGWSDDAWTDSDLIPFDESDYEEILNKEFEESQPSKSLKTWIQILISVFTLAVFLGIYLL